MPQCNCIADIDSKLEKHTLDTAICFSGNTLVARTYSGPVSYTHLTLPTKLEV